MSSEQISIPMKNHYSNIFESFVSVASKRKGFDQKKLFAIHDVSIIEGASYLQLLQKAGFGTEKDILSLIANAIGSSYSDTPIPATIDHELLEQFGFEFFQMHSLVPTIDPDGSKGIITSDPFDADLFALIEFSLGEAISIQVAPKNSISNLVSQFVPTKVTGVDETTSEDELRELAKQGPVIQFVQTVFTQAIQENASDIHFESEKEGLKTRFRINGALADFNENVDVEANAVISRLKYLSQLNISERRKPQDGRIKFKIHNGEVDLRLSILPTQYGQSAVVRILNQSRLALNWDTLGFATPDIKRIQNIISQPNGLFLVTGPTGSGKTTTLYTALAELNQPDAKIFTIEDPIEYTLNGVNQIQVNNDVGLTFASALRSILRQDPNIILIGEIRDAETAEMACRAALVGRLVLSTLHTNSAQQAETRLRDLGVADYLIDATLKGVLGQRLDISRCGACDGKGCSSCNGTGVGERCLSYELIQH